MTAPQINYPQFTMGHRMRLVLDDRGYSVGDAAERLEVSRNTISNWLNGHTSPRRRDVKAWCTWLAIPEEWLRWGVAGAPTQPGGMLPHLDSNQKPFVLRLARGVEQNAA
jgi:transcriptional regulator with XRE-family HTH domain